MTTRLCFLVRFLCSLSFLATVSFGLAACTTTSSAEPQETSSSQAEAFRGNQSTAPSTTQVERPSYAPEGFYPESNVGDYYGPCGPLSATWLMTWYEGRGPGGTGTNQGCFDRVSSFAQGDRLLPGSSPYGLSYAIDRVLEGSAFAGLARYRTGASIEDIRRLVSDGRPVIVLIQWKDEGARFVTMHYITIFGFRAVAGDTFTYLAHDNGSFVEISESSLEAARDTSFHNRGIVWMDRAASTELPH